MTSSTPLGTPLPFDDHACSVSLPTWCSVVGYEEGDSSIVSKMKCGYPRFVFHPYIVQLMDLAIPKDERHSQKKENLDCIIMPSKAAAVRCQTFISKALNVTPMLDASLDNAFDLDISLDQTGPVRIVDLGTKLAETYAVVFPATTEAAIEAKCYWQHSGEVVSSRKAEVALRELGLFDSSITTEMGSESCFFGACPIKASSSGKEDVGHLLRDRIASIVGLGSDSVFLSASGMSAIYSALRSSRRKKLNENKGRGGKAIVYGFPYLDTLKLCSRPEIFPDGVEFFGHGDAKDLESLENFLKSSKKSISAVITEFPSNPLLNCHDLKKLRSLADEYDFCLIVDDTISNFANIDLINTGIADAVCTSLTKLFNGRGDAMGGSIVVNPNTKMGSWMKEDLQKHHDDTLYISDAKALYENSADFLERSDKINKTSMELAEWFLHHEDVETTYYPAFSQPELYEPLMNKNLTNHTPGYAGLMSVVLGNHICQRQFYDSLDLSKGPSLGTNFTLLCPYTLLAHYHELEFARAYGVSPYLIRVSVGLESADVLKERFDQAFFSSKLFKKFDGMQKRAYSTMSARAHCTYVGRNKADLGRHAFSALRFALRCRF